MRVKLRRKLKLRLPELISQSQLISKMKTMSNSTQRKKSVFSRLLVTHAVLQVNARCAWPQFPISLRLLLWPSAVITAATGVVRSSKVVAFLKKLRKWYSQLRLPRTLTEICSRVTLAPLTLSTVVSNFNQVPKALCTPQSKGCSTKSSEIWRRQTPLLKATVKLIILLGILWPRWGP